jgi:RNA polymerase sigma-70 factor, ECF subfamily
MSSPISHLTDGELVRAVLDGNKDAFNVLVRRWERKVYTYVAHLTSDNEDAFDICQEAFVAAYRNLGRLRDPEKFPQWLFRIAHNAAYSHLRRNEDRKQDLDFEETSLSLLAPSAQPSKSSQLHGPEMRMFVEKALALLPVEQREAIVLKVYKGFKFAEIGEIQGCPESTAKTRVYTGFEQLKKLLQG